MKVILPSLGIYGCRSVDMRPATFDDLRAANYMNSECEGLIKLQFIKRLSDVDFTKITKCDADYLFAVAALSISFNTVNYSVSCSHCNHTISREFIFQEKEIDTLDKIELPVVRKINGVEYSYRIPSAQDELNAIEYALSQDDFETAYQNAMACFIFNKGLESIDEVRGYDAAVYLSAFVFNQCCFHGFNNLEKLTCPHCGAEVVTRVRIPASLISIDLSSIMESYSRVSDQLSFDSFLKFTIPEFSTLIESLNAQV